MGVFKKINFGLRKTRNNMSAALDNVLDSYTSIDEGLFDELEEALVMGDVGVATASEITMRLNDRVRKKNIKKPAAVKEEIKEIVAEMLEGGEDMGLITIPSVILVIGVNGVGKTTTIGKMAAMYKAQGKSVILAAADTFRAAAIDQLDVWAQRAGVEIVKHKEGADPAAVIYDTISAAKARGSEIIICDTAGRLHNKKNLMEELAKIYRIIDRELPYSDREVLLVLDATTGQNAVNQAREFAKIAEITGIILTKLDGTARGGVVLSIKNDLKVPVKFVGVGEGIDDLQPFNPRAFAEGLFEALPEDYNEDDIDLSKIREDIPESVPESDFSQELKAAFGEVLEAMNELSEEENASGESENSEADEKSEEPEALLEEKNDEVTEKAAPADEPSFDARDSVKEESDEKADEEASAQSADNEAVNEAEAEDGEDEKEAEKEEKPKKKKGFFGRLFG